VINIKGYEMGRTCSTHKRDEKIHTKGSPGNLKGIHRRRWKDNTRMDPRQIGLEGAGWIHLDRDQWWAVVNKVTNLRVP
jgi:hypothetical protein